MLFSSYYDKLGTMAVKSSRLTGIRDVSTTTIMNFAVPQAPRRIVGSKYYYRQFTSTMITTLLICVYTPPPSSTYFTRHYKDCFWDGSRCRSNHDIDDRDLCRVGHSECKDYEICVALDWIVLDMTFCLDDILGHCVSEPRRQDCPSSKDEVCGCDGFTYDNACKCFAAGTTSSMKVLAQALWTETSGGIYVILTSIKITRTSCSVSLYIPLLPPMEIFVLLNWSVSSKAVSIVLDLTLYKTQTIVAASNGRGGTTSVTTTSVPRRRWRL